MLTAVMLSFLLGNQHVLAGSLNVTNASSIVNGDVSSPATLQANPGPDGISLPEAVAAANNATEPQAITFDLALGGKTIALTAPLVLTRDGTTLTGLTTANGLPDVTIDARRATRYLSFLMVLASDARVSGFRFIGQSFDGIAVPAGRENTIAPYQARQHVRNVVIEDNIFGDSAPTSAEHAAVRIYMAPEGRSMDASIENVHVRRNTFLSYPQGVGVAVAANGTNSVIRNVVIEENTFIDIRLGVTVETANGSNNRVVGTRILRNRFVSPYGQPSLFIANLADPPPAFANRVDATFVAGNSFWDSANIFVLGGTGTGGEAAKGCTVSNTDFVNNLIVSDDRLTILGGNRGATGNHVDGVRFINNVVMAYGVLVAANEDTGIENSVSGVTFRNTIFSPETFLLGVAAEAVSHSLLSGSGFEGNGNLSGDPKFVDPAQGDFRLRADSPAINAGTSSGVPDADIECRPRVRAPDMGAHEFGAPDVARLYLDIADGRGSFDTSPAGFDCGWAKSFIPYSVVAITPVPSPGWRFAGWGGDADCDDGIVMMSGDHRCAGVFTPARRRAVRH